MNIISLSSKEKSFLKYFSFLLLFGLSIFFVGCNTTDSNIGEISKTYEYDFRDSEESWEPFFTNYNVGSGEDMDLTAEYRSLPEPLDTNDNAYFISAENHSDDVKMLFRKQIDDLEPGGSYDVQFTVRFATEVPSGCAGIGGPPGEAVRVIADASDIMPEPFIEDDYYLLNIQHRDNPDEWYQNAMIGDIANSRECEDGYEYEIKEVSSDPAHASVTADENGSAWLMFGTRSGFEGRTNLYYTYFKAELTRI